MLSSLRRPNEDVSDQAFLLNVCGRLWSAGVALDWRSYWTGEQRRRVELPTYPFQRRSYWINPDKITAGAAVAKQPAEPGAISTGPAQPPAADPVAAPGDQLERRLAEIFTQILGVESAGRQADFFELGGNSLLLARLATRIEKEFKRLIPLPFLFKSATIEKIAAFLYETSPKQSSFLVPLNDTGSGPAFFCVHSIDGDVMSFRHLAKRLGPDAKFYGIQVPPEKRVPEFASSVEAIARQYVDELLAFQPQGLYYLGGWSAGASLALEMAQQLEARGHTVGLLVAFDCAPFNTGGESSRWNTLYHWKLLCNFPHWLADNFGSDLTSKAVFHWFRNKLVAVAKKTVAAISGEEDLAKYEVEGWLKGSDYSPRQLQFSQSLFSALHRYKPKAYKGRVVAYQSKTQPLYHLLEVDRCWRKIAPQVEIVPVKGTHVSLIDEFHVDPIAQHLARRLIEFRNPD